MPIICPTVTAADEGTYNKQIESIAPFAHRIQIDLTDGEFAKGAEFDYEKVWWPAGLMADIHLMYYHPQKAVEYLVGHNPNLIIVHIEARDRFSEIAAICRRKGVKVGVALLPQSSLTHVLEVIDRLDHVLIFSGTLGHQGGHADLNQLNKVMALKDHRPNLEVGWDGGVTNQNVAQLVFGGVDVLDVGSYIQSADDPEKAFHVLSRIAHETGTT